MVLIRDEVGTVMLCHACMNAAPWTGRFGVGYPGFDGICAWCGALAQTTCTDEVNEPQVGAYGSMEWSPSLTVELYRPYVWDVNCYYRDLGVPTDATRSQIKAAYQERGRDDDRLTYIVKVLLDPEKRAVYDAVPPGDFYFDQYLREIVVRRVLADSGSWVDPSDAEMVEHAKTLREDLDRRMNRPVSDGPVDKDACSEETPLDRSAWGYYVWRRPAGAEHRMARWRCELALAMRDRGVTTQLRVGIARGLDAPWVILPIGHRPVAFLDDGEEPTPELAHAVVGFLHRA